MCLLFKAVSVLACLTAFDTLSLIVYAPIQYKKFRESLAPCATLHLLIFAQARCAKVKEARILMEIR